MSSVLDASPPADTSSESEFRRGLSLLDATMLVVGSMIGSGIFIVSADIARQMNSPGGLLLVWVVTGLITVAGALSYGELAAAMPRAGGQYVFLREGLGHLPGFLYGWTLFMVIQTGTIAAVAVAFASFLGVLVPWVSGTSYLVEPVVLGRYAVSLSTQQLVAIAMILLLTAVNARGLRTGRLIQNSFTVAKTGALFGLIVLGLVVGWNMRGAAFTSSWWNPWANGWTPQGAQPGLAVGGGLALALLLGRAMVGPLFAQSAWNNVTFTGEEVRDPGRTLPRALLTGCAVVVALYLLANLAYVVTLPLDGIRDAPQRRVAVAAMEQMFGPTGAIVMAVAILVSTFGCNNGLILAGARVQYAMARDGLFFARAARLNAQKVPAFALAAQGVWASLLTLPRTVTTDPATGQPVFGNVYTQLLEYIVSADLVFYGLMVAAVFVARRRWPHAPRPYRTFGYPVTPLIYLVIAALLVLDLAWLAPQTSGMGYLLVLTGVPVYLLWRRRFAADAPAASPPPQP
ncbi:MAG TPA: amino acid permease [Longimicrobium sp.]